MFTFTSQSLQSLKQTQIKVCLYLLVYFFFLGINFFIQTSPKISVFRSAALVHAHLFTQ